MRYAWIAIVIILLDQGIKWGMHASDFTGKTLIQLGTANFELVKSSWQPLERIYAELSNTTTLILLLSFITTHLLISRWSSSSYFITRRTKLGLQLASAGIIAYLIDNILAGHIQSTMRIDFSGLFSVSAGLADLAMMLGFVLLLFALYQGGSKIRCKIPLLPSDIAPLRLSHMPRGIDNIHIDVLLSPEFCKRSTRLIHSLVPTIIQHLAQRQQTVTLPKDLLEKFTEQFNTLLNSALHLAKSRGDLQVPNLFYLALQKFIHKEVANTVAATIQRQKERIRDRKHRGLDTQKDTRLVDWIFRNHERVIAQTNLTLLNVLAGEQNRDADRIIKSAYGKKETFIQQARHTPLVKAESSSDEHLLMNHYVTLNQQQDEKHSFLTIDKVLNDCFREFTPLIQAAVTDETTDKQLVRDSDTLSQPSPLMNQHNITILLDTEWTKNKLEKYPFWKNWTNFKRYRQHRYFQQRLTLQLLGQLQKAGLSTWINASYESQKLLRSGNLALSPITLTSLLATKAKPKEFQKNLRELTNLTVNELSIEEVTSSWLRIHNEGEELLKQNMLPFIRDFSQYRHDLAILFTYQRAASQFTLLQSEKDILTSRANHSLYEFLLPSERRQADAPILSHIIIKADLRGSTEVTQKLTEMELNPATHFDRNFFSPINELIDNYGAEKVFIEGDAIILILNQRQGDVEGRLIASHACGLAAEILQVVGKQNQELFAYGLPALELGIGIAFCHESPRYLFDQKHRITISPAINRADRLSACAWGVRQWLEQQNVPRSHVEVYQPSAKEMSLGEKAQKELVYNLNGVLLEPEVFEKLQQEIATTPLQQSLPQYEHSTLYGIDFPDMGGRHHSLVIRKAPVKIYDSDYHIGECPIVEDRFFYEVIHEKELLQQLLRRAI